MAFLTTNDLYQSILQDELDEITRGDSSVTNQAMLAAETEMRSLLFDTFDTDTIFASSTNRNPLLVQYGADLAIYYIVARGMGGQDFEDRVARYDRAIKWLKAVAKTEQYADLPRRAETKQAHITYGSNNKRSNYF